MISEKIKFDITNQRFGKLIAKSLIPRYHGRGTFWNCKCDCGNDSIARSDMLRKGRTISCGCLKYVTGKDNPSYAGYEGISNTFYGGIKYNASKKGFSKCKSVDFKVSIQYLWELFLKQNRKCVLSGMNLQFPSDSRSSDGTASLDRIDSSKGYIEGNVQWIHKDLNLMKGRYSDTYFIEMCKRVANNQSHRVLP